MNNESEKAVRPKWQIVILMVAASIAWVGILCCLDWTGIIDWDPERLEYIIVAAVALFIYLILFLVLKNFQKSLIQKNICAEPKKTLSLREKSLQFLKQFLELVAYPLHLALRLIARFLLMLAIFTTFLIPHLIVILFLIYIFSAIQEPLSNFLQPIEKMFTNIYESLTNKTNDNNTNDIEGISIISQIFLLFGGLSVFTFLFKREDILTPIFNMAKKTVDVFWYTRLPGVDIVESLLNTWRYTVKMIGRSITRTVIESIKLILPVLILCIGVYLSSFPAKGIFTWIIDIDTSPQNFIVLDSWNLPPEYLREKNNQFSLFFREDGELGSKTGICPADTSLYLEWLTSFRKAISDSNLKCPEDERVRLRVRGFASTSPVAEKGQSELDSTKSNTYNYQIANQRAEALVYFLVLPPDSIYTEKKCKDVLDSSSIWERKKENGTNVKPDSLWWKNSWGVTVSTEKVSTKNENGKSESRLRHTFSVSDSDTDGQKRKGFDVIYEPWQNHAAMTKAKLIKDGTLNSRRRGLEFLNRMVEIIIEDGGCLTTE